MNKPNADTEVESTKSVAEYAPLPSEIHEPQMPPQPEIDARPRQDPADERQYIHLESTADKDEGKPRQP